MSEDTTFSTRKSELALLRGRASDQDVLESTSLSSVCGDFQVLQVDSLDFLVHEMHFSF